MIKLFILVSNHVVKSVLYLMRSQKKLIFIFFLLSLTFSSWGQLSANFTDTPSSGCAPLIVHFTNTSTGATSYTWNFNNGTPPDTLTNPSASFLNPGSYNVILTAHNGSQSSTHSITVVVHNPPVVSFTASDTLVCLGTPAVFTNTSNPNAPPPSVYNWDFGDGYSSNATNASHIYQTPNYYTITLSITNSYGCIGSHTINSYIHVLQHPTANFVVNNGYICHPPGQVSFTNTSTGTGILTYQWNFGDNSPWVTTTSPTHTYSTIGSYNVTLITTDVNGCKDTMVQQAAVTVSGLNPTFTAPSTACVFSNVQFTNTTSQVYATSYWTFGNNVSSTLTNPVYQYPVAGNYIVKLVVYDGHCYDTVSHNITILPEPTTNFTYTPIHPCPAPAAIQFNSTSVTPGSNLTWSFGDNSPTSNATNPTHTFLTNDSFDVTLITTNGNGCADTVTQQVWVYSMFPVLQASPLSGCIPLSINFSEHPLTTVPDSNASPLPPYPYSVVSWSWNFGDGSPLNTQSNPTHIYNTVGIFHIHLTFTTANGCTFTDSTQVAAGVHPTLDSFTASPTHICNHNTVHFHAYVTGTGPFDYQYFFGDGLPLTDSFSSENHLYDSPAVYHPYVIVYNYGCPDTNTLPPLTITVDSPKALFSFTLSCDTPLKIVCHNYCMGADSVHWDFGDGNYSNSNSFNVTHLYNTYGNYTITLIAVNKASGCLDTMVLVAQIYKLQPSFVANDTAICDGGTVTFTSTVTGGPTPLYYLWYINGAFIDTPVNLTYTFNTVGFDTVMLRVIDQHNCSDTFTRKHYIRVAKPTVQFYAVPTQGCRPLFVNFYDTSSDIAGMTLVSHSWRFGDGQFGTTTGPDTSHLYSNTGSYSVQEVVTDNLGCKDSLLLQGYINVYHPVAGFTVNNLFPCPYSTVIFTDTSVGNNLSYHWNFGDGDTSIAGSPTHVYTDTGLYTIKLIVTDQSGCTDSVIKLAYLHVTRPTASFTVSDTTGICIPLIAHFTNTSVGSISNFWNLGNGNTSTAPNPGNSYSIPGLYQVMLVATNSHGCTDTAIRHVSLYGYAGSFSYSPLIGCKPLLVNFTANVVNIPNLYWDFSDGTIIGPSPLLTATHTYTTAGAYLPKLILKDSSGCTASSQGIDTIKVDEVTTGYKTIPYPICIYDTVQFADTSLSMFSKLAGWKWVFNNSYNSTQANPVFYYGNPGTFPVEEIVTDSLGCTDSAFSNVVVNGLPTITANADTIICLGDAAHLNASGGATYTWTPPGTLSCNNCQSPLATPTAVTEYYVIGTDANGCKNTDSTMVSIKTKTTSIAGNDTFICAGGTVQLQVAGAQIYTWYPSTGLSSNVIPDPIASPVNTIKYMIVAVSGSCIPDTNYVTVTVHPNPTISVSSNVTIIENTTTTLQASGVNIKTYIWSPDYGLSCDTCSNPTVKIQKTTTFKVTGYSAYGCMDTADVTVRVICDKGQVFVPNTFTPNGDGQNDVFFPRGVGIDKIKSFRIYDRWGELIFEKTNIDMNDESNGWDGTCKGNKPRPDVYVYSIDAICLSGEEINWKGDVTLVR